MKYRNSGANEEHIIQNRFTAYLLVALQRRKVDFLLRRYSHQQHEQPVEAINTAYASIYDLEDAICQTLDLQTEYAALMRLLVTLPERENDTSFPGDGKSLICRVGRQISYGL